MIPWGRRSAINDTFSEFTYAFALVNELITLGKPPIVSVPVFPSLVQEGRASGGYDVKFDRPGRPLFLQFKLAKQIRGRRAREFQQRIFRRSFYRMYIRPKRSSRQHELLLELEQTNRGSVFYCAPAFHTLWELNNFYERRRIVDYSRFVLIEDLKQSDSHPLGATIDELAEWLTAASGRRVQTAPPAIGIPTHYESLATVARFSQTVLNSTLCILQPAEEDGTGGPGLS